MEHYIVLPHEKSQQPSKTLLEFYHLSQIPTLFYSSHILYSDSYLYKHLLHSHLSHFLSINVILLSLKAYFSLPVWCLSITRMSMFLAICQCFLHILGNYGRILEMQNISINIKKSTELHSINSTNYFWEAVIDLSC